ncbi:hypothetical protein GEMRC1_001384 [Eukaryota sp. GEM-RC1]
MPRPTRLPSKFQSILSRASSFVPAHSNSVPEALTPTIVPHEPTLSKYKELSSNSVDIVSQLYYNKQKEFLTDKVIVFHGQSYPCHSSFLSSFSPVLKEKLLSSDPEVSFPQLEFIVPDANIFFDILDYFYGQSFQLTFGIIGAVLAICSALDLSSLNESIQKALSEGFSKSCHLQLKSEEVLQTIRSSVERDVMLSYKNKSLTISSLMLICSSEYFKNLFCQSFADSNERKFTYSEEFSGVSGLNFEIFFKYFLGEAINLDFNNVVDFYQLSVYFQVKNLKDKCNSFVSSLSSTRDIFRLLKTISERNLLNMLQGNLNLFSELLKDQDLPSPFPLPLSFIVHLIERVDSSWLLQCLTLSITNEVFEEDYHILSQIFEKLMVNDQNITKIYTIMQPLFDQDYLCQFLSIWSMKVFQGVQNVNVIPDEWFLWCLSQSCLNHKRWKISDIDFLVQNFSLIIEASDLSKNSNCPYLNPETFKNVKNNLPSSYDLFLINSFEKSWKETELWTVKNFEDEILTLDLQSSTDSIDILNILSKLTTDSRLAPFLTANLLNQSLSTLNQHHQELKEVKKQLSDLKEWIQPWIQKFEENEKIKKEARIGKFNPDNCGFELCLSNNNTICKKEGHNDCVNSFVEVSIPNNCSVKFTGLNTADTTNYDYIGWKERDHVQDESYPFPCIGPRGDSSSGTFSPSDPMFTSISKGESITVSFSNGIAYFKPSTCTTTFSIDIPSNLVFGMMIFGQNHEWKVESV